ncbi:MAG: ABC transporter permease [Anaerolineae bacterium]|jgi:lipopolysaccharide transport system permease protein|nr:ABC transporter permease [Anaerolineae bacterium]
MNTHKPITVIQPQTGFALPNLREVWRYRAVITNMVGRNFKVQYRQTIGGPIYAIYTPLMTMLGYTILLGGLLNVQTDGNIPYPIFSYSALIIWTLFTTIVTEGSTSLFTNSALIQKIYVPHLIFPLIIVAMALVNFAIAFLILLPMMLIYGVPPSANVIAAPVFLMIAIVTGLGLGLWFAPFHARFRDTLYLVRLITQGLFFLTPAVYSSQLLPAPWDQLYQLNPLAVVIEGFRWSLLGVGNVPSLESIAYASGIAIFLLILGALNFKRLEPTIADVI